MKVEAFTKRCHEHWLTRAVRSDSHRRQSGTSSTYLSEGFVRGTRETSKASGVDNAIGVILVAS